MHWIKPSTRILLLLVFAFYEVTAAQIDLSKKVSINVENIELGKSLLLIERESGVKLAYSSESIPVKRKVHLKYNNTALSEVLDDISRKNDLQYEVEGDIVVLSHKSLVKAQKSVSGKVSDAKGEALVGVSVLLKNTQVATSTDVNGNYSISLPTNTGTLIFSYLGFLTKEVPIGNQSQINVVMDEDDKTLNEVVVVGY